jgi:hypothetical protein
MLYREEASNENRGSGTEGVENRFGRAESKENPNRIRRGRS